VLLCDEHGLLFQPFADKGLDGILRIHVTTDDMSRMLLDALLPNRAWWSRFHVLPDRRTKIVWIALRFGLLILAIGAIAIFARR
jgi:hypothetical protein